MHLNVSKRRPFVSFSICSRVFQTRRANLSFMVSLFLPLNEILPDNLGFCRNCWKVILGHSSLMGFPSQSKIRWKIRFTLTSIPRQRSLQNYVHDMTAVLSWHVQQFAVMSSNVITARQNFHQI